MRAWLVAVATMVSGCRTEAPEPFVLSETGEVPASSTSSTANLTAVTSDTTTSESTATTNDTSSSSTGEADSTSDSLAQCGDAPPGSGTGCPIRCSHCEDFGVCSFECLGPYTCTDNTIECPNDRSCTVNCSGDHSCHGTTVICPPTYECRVRCFGAQACGSMAALCNSGPCNLECNSPSSSCFSSQFHCGNNESIVTCNSSQLVPPVLHETTSKCVCTQDGCGP